MLVTALAFIAAAFVVGIELRRDRIGRQQAEREEQAALVAVWHDARTKSGAAVRLMNGSRLPVYDVAIGLAERNDDETYLVGFTRDLGAVPPGQHQIRYQRFKPTATQRATAGAAAEAVPVEDLADMQLVVWFKDAAGRHWFRTPRGRLHRLDDLGKGLVGRLRLAAVERAGATPIGHSYEFDVDA